MVSFFMPSLRLPHPKPFKTFACVGNHIMTGNHSVLNSTVQLKVSDFGPHQRYYFDCQNTTVKLRLKLETWF